VHTELPLPSAYQRGTATLRQTSLRAEVFVDYVDFKTSSLGYSVGGLGDIPWWFVEKMIRHWQVWFSLVVVQSGCMRLARARTHRLP
jgi:hypothetical protein